ncbi:MAG: diadenylate cyclase CdaA [Lachnospiraceae bacterium]|nr:diadenylate cyclase CdaA [Lachnospiraceae bacterium]MBR1875779.1 diadenylate cyclase CdaA [Lachnospiraceae bacterium]
MEQLFSLVEKYISLDSIPKMGITDYIEILIITFVVYKLMAWIKDTRAWSLLKGIVVIVLFIMAAYVLQMTTILWLVRNMLNVAIMALVVIFQPELRKALDILGRKSILASAITFNPTGTVKERFSDKTINEIVKASFEMGKVRTGALIVVAHNDSLSEYIRTGIEIDSTVTNQLLINIFEHNTPLHDGAVIIDGDRIVSATCYLPLSDNMALSKELGTRHRAGVGISETTDSITVIVSEETGRVSVAADGQLFRNVDADQLREKLASIQDKTVDEKRFRLWKGRSK